MSEEASEQIAQRRQKLEKLRAEGMNPYPNRFQITHTIAEARSEAGKGVADAPKSDKETLTLAGRLTSVRRHGRATFGHIRDFTGEIQIYVRQDVVGPTAYELFADFDLGDFVGVTGQLFRTRTGELTLWAAQVQLLAKALRPLPEKWHGLRDVETRYRQRYVDLVANPRVRETFDLRSRLIQCIRDFLNQRGFLEVETPMMHPIPGGAAAKPFVTYHNALQMELYLRIAPELYLKRLVIGGMERVYELSRNFRNEGISTKHNPEFTMLEFYMSYADYTYLMALTEEMFQYLAERLLGKLQLIYQGNEIDLTPPWPRYSYREALEKIGGLSSYVWEQREAAYQAALAHGINVEPSDDHMHLLNKLLEAVVEPKLIQPTIVHDFPAVMCPLAKVREDDPSIAERFEVFIGGREIVNAYTELNDPILQRRRFEEQMAQRAAGDEQAHRMDADYVRALEYGMPPTAGEGIGIDRLVMLFTDSASIREVILFPLLRPEKPEE